MSPLGKRGRRFINILPAISSNYAISWSQGVATPPAKRHRLEGNPRRFGKKNTEKQLNNAPETPSTLDFIFSCLERPV